MFQNLVLNIELYFVCYLPLDLFVLNYFLIKANGVIGAAQATTITFFVSFVLTWILSAKVYKMPWFKVLSSLKIKKEKI